MAKTSKSKEAKTQVTGTLVSSFIEKIPDEGVRDDCRKLVAIMGKATGEPAKMWGESIVGFGAYHYKYESGHEGNTCLVGFSPRKLNISLYIARPPEGDNLVASLGKIKSGKSCLYIKRLEDIKVPALEALIEKSVSYLKNKYNA